MRLTSARAIECVTKAWMFLSAIALLLGGAAPCSARQCNGWEEILAAGPAARSQFCMVYMDRARKTLLFGGQGREGEVWVKYDDTWTWDGAEWTQLQVAGPTPRVGANIAYDPLRDRVLLYGGLTSAGRPTDTWEWDGQRWRLLSETGPEIVGERSMAFDPSIGRIILFDGRTGRPSKTWVWTGHIWLLIATNGPAVSSYALVTDTAQGRIVMITDTSYREIWEWNGSAWHWIAKHQGPELWYKFDAAFDASRSAILVTGGAYDGNYNDETWEWNGQDWSLLAKEPRLARYSHRMVYDASRDRLVLFGGYNDLGRFADTWEADADTFLSIIEQPRSIVAIPGHDAGFSVRTVGSGPMAYQWRKDGEALEDGGRISGSRTAGLRIEDVGESDVGAYDVLVRRECGERLSESASLTLRVMPLLEVGGHCPGQVGVRLTRARPNGSALLIYGGTRREWFQWIEPCGPMYLEIGPPGAALIGFFRVDESGSVNLRGYAGPGRCSGYLQFVDLRQCLLSNVVEVPD